MITYFIALVWFLNGAIAKVTGFVPRHQQIVERILGSVYKRPITIAIGIAEIGMCIWVLSGILPQLNALTQIAIILLMNIIEQYVCPDLLLWRRWNLLFAVAFCCITYYNTFIS